MLSIDPKDPRRLDGIFSALGDPSRRQILSRLTGGEVALSALADPLPMSQTAATRHVRVLRDAGLVSVEKRGRTRYVSLRPQPMKEATDWLSTYRMFWESAVDRLGTAVQEP